MTPKEHHHIAEALRRSRPPQATHDADTGWAPEYRQWRLDRDGIADALREISPGFNRNRFVEIANGRI